MVAQAQASGTAIEVTKWLKLPNTEMVLNDGFGSKTVLTGGVRERPHCDPEADLACQ
jgi:hypothetical protein